MRSALHHGVTPEEFLAWEREQPERHEYRAGEVFAMAGGSPRHAALSANLVAELRSVLRDRGCQVFSSDLQVGLADGSYVYADVTVVCGPVELHSGTRDVVANPRIVVEVLSPSTESYDRGLKWDGYRRVASLTDYLLVSQDLPRIEHFSREPDGSWRYRVAGVGERVALVNDAGLAVDAVFAGALGLPGG
jgi:Uma2 family endonuclease